MAATLMLACSNDKSGGHDGDEGVETEVNGTQLDGNTTLYGLVTDTSGNPIPGVVVSDGYGCVTTDANGVYQMERYKKARFVHYSTPAGYAINTSADNYPLFYAEIVHKNIADRHDFVLTPLPAPESDFTLVCIADPQCATTAEISRYVNETIPDVEATVDAYKAKGTPVYGITLGDIVFDTPDLWSNMKESMANRNLPVFQTIGNHDHPRISRKTFKNSLFDLIQHDATSVTASADAKARNRWWPTSGPGQKPPQKCSTRCSKAKGRTRTGA